MAKGEDASRLVALKAPPIVRLGPNEAIMVFGSAISRRVVSMISVGNENINLFSRPYQQRIAFVPISIALVFAWVVVITSLILLFNLKTLPLYCSFVVMAAGTYLTFFTGNYIEDSKQQYELQIDSKQISLSVYNQYKNTRIKQQISLGELISAEYFTTKDVSSLFLHGKNNDLEIPLWTFGPQAEHKVIDYIKAHGIETTYIPSPVGM
jgi:hypothetical protein